MGAALTYARRYALFTLVGIAGEDDLDAPDLISPAVPEAKTGPDAKPKQWLNGGPRNLRQGARGNRVSNSTLEPSASAAVRDELIAELRNLSSGDEAAEWAHRVMGKKNSLVPKDAEQVEVGFQLRLSTLMTDRPNASESIPRARPREGRNRQTPINKTLLTLPVPRRARDREHVKTVAQQPCLVCGRRPADAHHLRCAQLPALGRKVSDEFTVPLCRGHHREVHHCGNEAAWWKKTGIDPTTAARVLWLKTHPLPLATNTAGAKLQNEPNSVSPS
jgi:hypothetical protein